MRIFYRNKGVEVDVKKTSFLGRLSGLMFRTREAENLLFDFGRSANISLHSLFVFFDFLVLWLDENDRVIDFKIVKPFALKVNCGRFFRKIVEIPINDKNIKIVHFFVGKRKV